MQMRDDDELPPRHLPDSSQPIQLSLRARGPLWKNLIRKIDNIVSTLVLFHRSIHASKLDASPHKFFTHSSQSAKILAKDNRFCSAVLPDHAVDFLNQTCSFRSNLIVSDIPCCQKLRRQSIKIGLLLALIILRQWAVGNSSVPGTARSDQLVCGG